MTVEVWLPIPDFHGYEVSDLGRVKSKKRKREIILKPSLRIWGYYRASLAKDGKMHQILVGRLVLLAFVGPCPDGQETRHLNGIRADNRLSNLAWGTRIENAQDKRQHGTMCFGEKHGRSKITEAQAIEIIKKYSSGYTQVSLAQEYGIYQTKISALITGKTWKHLDRSGL